MEIEIMEDCLIDAHKIKAGNCFVYGQNNSHNTDRDGEFSDNLFLMTYDSKLDEQYIDCFNLTKCQNDRVARNQKVRPVHDLKISAKVAPDPDI